MSKSRLKFLTCAYAATELSSHCYSKPLKLNVSLFYFFKIRLITSNTVTSFNKTAELSQRRPRDAPNMGALKSFESPHYAPGYFSQNL